MDAIGLDRAGKMDHVFVDHGDEGSVMFVGQVAEDLLELQDILLAIVGRQRDSGEQGFDVGVFQGCQHGIDVAAGLGQGQAAQAVIAAKLDNNDCRMQKQNGMQTGYGVFGGGATGSLVDHLVEVAAAVEVALQSIGKGLAGFKAVSGGDAVTVANQQGPFDRRKRAGEKNQPKRNDNPAANVHRNSVAKSGNRE